MSDPAIQRSQPFQAACVFLLTLIVYLATMPTSITLEDAGLFQMICRQGGIGHPPGYPVFILGCQAFTQLPFFDSGVFAANLLSALYASTACSILYCVLRLWSGRTDLALTGAFLYGLSATFWSQAIIVEVYSLSALLFIACLWLTLLYARTTQPRWLVILAFVYGLGLANHWPQLGLATPALLVLLWQVREELIGHLLSRWFAFCLLALAAGLLPYLSLFQEAPRFAVFGAVDTWQEFTRYVARAAYDDQFPVADWTDKARFQGWVAMQTLQEFSIALAPLMLAGIYRSFAELKRSEAVGLLVLYAGGTSLLIAMLGFEFTDIRITIFEPYPLVAYIAPVTWTAIGCTWLKDVIGRHSVMLARVVPLVAVLLALVANFPANNRRSNHFAEIYGLTALSLVPDDAVLFVEGDNGVGLIGYLHYVAGVRPDIELRSWNNLVFPNRLVSPFAPREQQAMVREAFIGESGRRVYRTLVPEGRGARIGLVMQLGVDPRFVCPAGLHDYIDYLLEVKQSASLPNGHERSLLDSLLLDVTRLHAGLLVSGGDAGEERVMLERLQQTFPGRIGTVETLLQVPHEDYDKPVLWEMMTAAAESLPPYPDRRLRAVIDEYLGRIAMIEPGDTGRAIDHLTQAVEVYPAADNTALCPLERAYILAGMEEEAAMLRKRWGEDLCR